MLLWSGALSPDPRHASGRSRVGPYSQTRGMLHASSEWGPLAGTPGMLQVAPEWSPGPHALLVVGNPG